MKRFLCALLALCLCIPLAACGKPTESDLYNALSTLVMQDAVDQLQSAAYYHVAVTKLEPDGKNQWIAEGSVSYTNNGGVNLAVPYTTTLRYDPKAKTFSTDTVFEETFRI